VNGERKQYLQFFLKLPLPFTAHQVGALAVGAGAFGVGAASRNISASSSTKLMWLHLNKYFHAYNINALILI
jgi:hypothetical protein